MTRLNRQLAAIMFTDIAGYSGLMRQDERQALAIRARHREVFNSLTARYGGRILQYYGDGTLSIFNSAVAAVECAVAMQAAFRESPAVPLRIGIHTGDISFDDTDVFGDGLNVAARVEPCAPVGGIFITGKVYDDIRNHEWLSARSVGAFTFRGLDEPVPVFAIDNEGLAVPNADDLEALGNGPAKLVSIVANHKPASIVPEKVRQIALLSIPVLLLALLIQNIFFQPAPQQIITYALPPEGATSIAVLPFENLNQLEQYDYFSNGISNDIQSFLSRVEGLKVVSRNSTRDLKGKPIDIPHIGHELNAQHIIKGSVSRQGDNLRIMTELIDANADSHMWSKTYDCELKDIFDVRSQMAHDIATALKKQIPEKDFKEMCRAPTDNVKAYDYYQKGRELYGRYTREDNDEAISMFHKALSIDPKFAQAYAGLGDALAQKAHREGMSQALLDSAIQAASKAVSLDNRLSEGYKALGLAYQYRGWHDKALQKYYEAVKLDPNNDMAINNIGAIFQEQGRIVEAIEWARRGASVNPRQPWASLNLARMYHAVDSDEESLALLDQGMRRHPDFAPLHELRGAILLRRNELEAARALANNFRGKNPGDPWSYKMLGEVALMRGNLEEARYYFNEAARRDPARGKLSESQLHLAMLAARLNDDEPARQYLRGLQKEFQSKIAENPKPYYLLALSMTHAQLGQIEPALDALGQAVDRHWMDYRLARSHPYLENLRDEPRFEKMMLDLQMKTSSIRHQLAGASHRLKMS
jgi:adenylate cyclase